MSSIKESLARRLERKNSLSQAKTQTSGLKIVDPPKDSLQAKLKRKVKQSIARGGSPDQQEIHRITELPVVKTLMTSTEVREFTDNNALVGAVENGWSFFRPQAQAIRDYEKYNGAFCPIGVGFGKTLVTLMVAAKAYKEKGIRKSFLLVPASVYPQLTMCDIQWARRHVTLGVPFFFLGKDADARLKISRSGRPGCYIIPYSCLSTKNAVDVINNVAPELIIADEVQNLKNKRAARTRRLFDYIRRADPQMVALSGTITKKSIRDYHHIITQCLKERCPLPRASNQALDWAAVLDSDAAPSVSQTGPIKPLIRWAQDEFPQEVFRMNVSGFRAAYRHRLNTCPGVVASSDMEIGTSLILSNTKATGHTREGWQKLLDLIDDVETRWVTPNGDEIEHAIHTYKWLYELNSGFYNELVWPETEEFARRRKTSVEDAHTTLALAQSYHRLHQDYARNLRDWIKSRARPGLDTPFTIGSDMLAHGDKNVGKALYRSWKTMKDADFDDRPDRDSNAIRVCDHKIEEALVWASNLKEPRGIIWVFHKEIGEWAVEKLSEVFDNVLACPAGKQYDKAIIDATNANKLVVASMSAHGTGKNLQHFQNQFFLQWPRDATLAEQVLGRTHRSGQTADELLVHTCHSSVFDRINFSACLNDSLYIHQTTGQRQKLVYCSYDPPPVVFSPEFLRERGADNKVLTSQQRKDLQDKFGEFQK